MKHIQSKPLLALLVIAATLGFLGCTFQSKPSSNPQDSADEEALYRPEFHFTPKANWMNDPNGMFYFEGKYHLYFQHYPDKNVWGPMHWGHAESRDMIHWEEKPIALYPDSLGYIFSGSAVVDHQNTSGFGTDGTIPIVAMFTHHDMEKEIAEQVDVESQSIAYSLDQGLTWTKYSGNPVIANPNIRDFRDPKVFWHETTQKWVMVLAAHDQVMIYGSPDLKEWTYLSSFGKHAGNHDAVWECPDLFPLPVAGEEQQKYVLLVSNSRNSLASGSATQYFVGDFDGTHFRMDPHFEQELKSKKNFWMDFGKDNYAGVSWQNIQRPSGNRLLIGWMSNWEYATKVPTQGWRSAMTIARELSLKPLDSSYRLISQPVQELQAYQKSLFKEGLMKITPQKPWQQPVRFPAELRISFVKPQSGQLKFSMTSLKGNRVDWGFDVEQNHFFLDRKTSGIVDFSPSFADQAAIAPRLTTQDTIQARVLIDKTSIEIFWDEGLSPMTSIFFPQAPMDQLSIATSKEILDIAALEIFEIDLSQHP